MNDTVYKLLNEVCNDFSEYKFLKTDMYKGKIIGGHNLYYKKGESEKEGIIIGKRDIAKFDLERFPKNFKTYNRFDQSDIEEGWTGDTMVQVLQQIQKRISEDI